MPTQIQQLDKENIAPLPQVEKANIQELIRKLYVGELKHSDEEGESCLARSSKSKKRLVSSKK